MNSELQEYLEQEYSDFEGSNLGDQRFWRAPVSALRGTALFSLFDKLCASFPDHPSEHNTVFYLTESASGTYSVLLTCTHFEHAALEDVRGLMDFLQQAASPIVRDGSIDLIALELLDSSAEKLHVRFYEPVQDIVTLLQQHATRRSA
jgi:hypothetical protein